MALIDSFRGGNDDQVRPDANVALAFVLAALIVGVVGVRWMGSTSGASGATSSDNGWALGATADVEPDGTEIPASPAAVAVRVGAVLTPGAASASTTQPLIPGFPSFPGFPDDVPLDDVPPGTDPSTGPTTPGGSTPPTTRTTTSMLGSTTTTTEPPSTTTTTEEPTTTTTEEPTTTTTEEPTTTSSTEVPPEPITTTSESAPEGTLDGVSAFFDAFFG